jgi:hypothetical protein
MKISIFMVFHRVKDIKRKIEDILEVDSEIKKML